MKKLITASIAVAICVGAASAKEPVKVTAEVAAMSAYVWRGQVINKGAVIQPQVTLEQYGVSLNFWGNWDIERNPKGQAGDFSEIDLTLAYTLPIDINQATIDLGVTSYQFPANDNASAGNSTAEIYVKGTIQAIPFIKPSLTLYGDVKEVKSGYALFDIVAPFEISDYLAVEAGFSAGYGGTRYNTVYWEQDQDAGWNDYNFYANAAYEVLEGVTVSANLTFTMVDGTIRDAAEANYDAKQRVWGGVSVAYDF